ncbi:carbon-nitrogen hydrolase family protein [Hyphomonas sp. WL0036]|uniref:carbon-nitrogen hydrolase family protein n=1 Tax=Hyphomonas sediminis TaxID=2866160 RepID=UPI001C7FD25E|nr:carbon-nitrogen hydrolase family protein [Hyphomonas sediminis]MBY9066465.1 carbon-nitrogen hydrolase family protein [Hyphomonas sediminis]
MTATRTKLVIRNAKPRDIPAILPLYEKVYGVAYGYTADQIAGQINKFPDGQFVAEFEGQIVGHCVTFMINSSTALAPHTWNEITGGGFAARHDPEGDMLYGMDVIVDSEFRRLRIGQRFYKVRQDLCQWLELKGILFGGRIPGYQRHQREYPNPADYVEAVKSSKLRDPVLSFQLRQGFELVGILRNYMPEDFESCGHATQMFWRNPLAQETIKAKPSLGDTALPERVRVATVQFQMRRINSIDDFEQQVEYFVDIASDYRADFVTFPELFTLQLLSLESKPLGPVEAIEKISEYTPRFIAFMERLAVSYNINIIGGSHPSRMEDGDIHNVAYIFLRDGSVHTQQKLHPTPSERTWWNIKGGEGNSVIQTDCGPIGVMICYDSEFPEIARHLVDQGALMLFVPFCTDERRGYLRVRYCCAARAIENQCYVVLSGVVGNLPNVENMDIHYAESCILTPSDFPFARDGVAADTAPNTETVAIADLSLSDLLTARQSGAVQNLKDRRFDLYRVAWK